MINNWAIAPDISSLLGDAYNLGSGGSFAVADLPFLLCKYVSIFRSGDGYWGLSHASGIAKNFNDSVVKPKEFEVHGGYSYTWDLTQPVNMFELLGISLSQ